ncbi:hypothetical protein V7S43_010251 [Phytophthora oleae]|uniref:glucan 1,3-beta-glucosidase n=1 Tax=Phytophthora oleae TaxID=2107226 RepID=A0ABD3FDV9_9STRA
MLLPTLFSFLITTRAKIRCGEARARAVNLGGWLVSEYWMSWDSFALWEGVPTDVASQGEYSIIKYLGKEAGTAAFEDHWQTWITESDIQEISSTGVLNTVRVPVSYWIIRNAVDSPGDDGDVFAPGGLKHLDTLINDWAMKHNLAVIVSLHAHQGSQNGYAHSARYTRNHWVEQLANEHRQLAEIRHVHRRSIQRQRGLPRPEPHERTSTTHRPEDFDGLLRRSVQPDT